MTTSTLSPPRRADRSDGPGGPRPDAARLEDVRLDLGGRRILDGLDLAVAPGEIVALVGASGGGKSTTLRVLAGLASPDSGRVHTEGRPAVAFQDPRLLPWRTVRQNVAHGARWGAVRGADEARRRAETILAEVGLAERADEWPGRLSGGQAQRVSLARALAGEPGLLLLDEPFGALDALTRRAMHQVLLDLWRAHRTAVLLVTHDVDEALALADRVVVLSDGRIAHTEVLDSPRETLDPGEAELRRGRLLSALEVTP